MRKTRSSRSISSDIAWFKASRYCRTAILRSLLGDVRGDGDVFEQGLGRWVRGRLGERDRLVAVVLDLLVALLQRLLVDPVPLLQKRLEQDDGVALPGLPGLFLGAVLHRVAHRVAAEPVSFGLDEGRPLAGAGALGGLAGHAG